MGQIGLNLVLFISKYNKMTSYYAVDRSRKTVLPGPSCPGKVSNYTLQNIEKENVRLFRKCEKSLKVSESDKV